MQKSTPSEQSMPSLLRTQIIMTLITISEDMLPRIFLVTPSRKQPVLSLQMRVDVFPGERHLLTAVDHTVLPAVSEL